MSIAIKRRSGALATFLGIAAFVAFIGPAAASDQRDVCATTQGDEKVDACSRAIDAGIWQGRELAPLYLNRGQAYLDRWDFNLALSDFNQAIRLDPNLAAAYDGRGLFYKFYPDRAIADYDEAIRLDPNSAKAYIDRSAAYRAKGDNDLAIADLDMAIRLAPDSATAYRSRGLAYQANNDLDHAIADFDSAIARDVNDRFAYFDRGTAYQQKGDLDRAIADYDTAIRVFPFTHAYEMRASAYQAKGDLDRAIADDGEAIRRDPNDARAFHDRGLARQAKGDMAAGAADLARAHALSTIVGLPMPIFTKLHAAVGLIGILSGAVVMVGMVLGKWLPRWTILFLGSETLTSVSGFLFPSGLSSPSFPFGVTSLVMLAVMLVALFVGRLRGHWRWVYVVAALTMLYVNVYDGIMRAIFTSPFMLILPRQMEPPFAAVTLTALAIFVVLGIGALRRFPSQYAAA